MTRVYMDKHRARRLLLGLYARGKEKTGAKRVSWIVSLLHEEPNSPEFSVLGCARRWLAAIPEMDRDRIRAAYASIGVQL